MSTKNRGYISGDNERGKKPGKRIPKMKTKIAGHAGRKGGGSKRRKLSD
jgi:hypothetical protein